MATCILPLLPFPSTTQPNILNVPFEPIDDPTVEFVGRAYEALLRAAAAELGLTPEVEVKSPLSAKDVSVSKKEAIDDAKYAKMKDDFTIDLGDYYALLGLADVGFDATEDQIRTAHRAVSLYCHPDKADSKNREKAEQRFKAMQKAHEILSDPGKRKLYESSVHFDDTLPDDDEGIGAEFYETYGPVFKAFSRYSVVKPVPELGNPKTPYDEVDQIYDFWLSFKSWRDFNFMADHKLTDAHGRDEKRYMMKENQKKAQIHKKAETATIRRLVEDAMKKDPRIKKRRDDEENKKKAEKQAKIEKRKKDQEEKERLQQEEKARLEAEKAAEDAVINEEKKKKQREKDTLRKLRAKFRKVALSGAAGTYTTDDIVYVAENLQLEPLLELVAAFDLRPANQKDEDAENKQKLDSKKKEAPKKGKGKQKGKEPEKKETIAPFTKEEKEAAQAAFKKAMDIVKEAELEAKRKLEELKAQERLSKRQAIDEGKTKEQWTLEEMSILAKAVAKFPAGLTRRWERITEMVNTVGSRPMKEIITKCKEFDQEQQRLGKDESFKRYQEVMTNRLAAKEDSKVRQLGEADSEAPKSKTQTKVIPKAVAPSAVVDEDESDAENKGKKGKKGKKQENKAPEKTSMTPKRPFMIKVDDTPKPAPAPAPKEAPAKAKAPIVKAAPPAKQPAAAVAPPVIDEWSTEQQVAFEKALREVPKSDDRWDKIAARVAGKTKKDCVARFKEIRAKIISGKK